MGIYTVGHSTRSAAELVRLMTEAGVDLLVDIRTAPRSRTNPQFNVDVLPVTLADAAIGYRHLRALGGLRGRSKGEGHGEGNAGAASPNAFWKVAGFRNYADYALTPPFRTGLDELLGLADEHSCAIMCAEALWWRCHRRIVTDYLLAEELEVFHILGPGKIEPARLTPEAVRRSDGLLIYPAVQGTLL